MSQRGGAVQSFFRLSDKPIFSDIIPLGSADLILSVEPMEALRYLPYLSENGWVVTNTTPFNNITDYPEIEQVMQKLKSLKHCVLVDADQIAKDAGSLKASNMVMLGAASPFIGLDFQTIEDSICAIFGRKGQAIVDMNILAFRNGKACAQQSA